MFTDLPTTKLAGLATASKVFEGLDKDKRARLVASFSTVENLAGDTALARFIGRPAPAGIFAGLPTTKFAGIDSATRILDSLGVARHTQTADLTTALGRAASRTLADLGSPQSLPGMFTDLPATANRWQKQQSGLLTPVAPEVAIGAGTFIVVLLLSASWYLEEANRVGQDLLHVNRAELFGELWDWVARSYLAQMLALASWRRLTGGPEN